MFYFVGQKEPKILLLVMIIIVQVLTLSVNCYRAAPQAAALELCKQFFIMYGREQ